MNTELDERINPEAIHKIRIGNDDFDMFGHKLIELLTNPSEVELCIGSIPKKWVDDPEALASHLYRNESCITVPLGCSRGNVSAKQHCEWLFGLVEFSEEAISHLRHELIEFDGFTVADEMKDRIAKALTLDPREADKILLRHLKDTWVDRVGLEAEVEQDPCEPGNCIISSFSRTRDWDIDDEPVVADLLQLLFLHEQRQDIKRLCRYMGLHHIAEKAASMQLTSVPAIRQLAIQ